MVIMSGCGKEDDSIYGQVTGISDQSITIEVGTRKDSFQAGDKPDEGQQDREGQPQQGERTDGERPESGKPDGEPPVSGGAIDSGAPVSGGVISGANQPSMLNLTGESRTITVDEDTEIYMRTGEDTEEAVLADISENSVVSVVVDEKTNIADKVEIVFAPFHK